VLRSNIANLKLAISDQNLELVPDYEQRVEVLKELKFLEANSTVSLKGRVACEVSCLEVFQRSVAHVTIRSILLMNSFSPSSFWTTLWQPTSPRKWLRFSRLLSSKRKPKSNLCFHQGSKMDVRNWKLFWNEWQGYRSGTRSRPTSIDGR